MVASWSLEIFLQDFLVILQHSLQNYKKRIQKSKGLIIPTNQNIHSFYLRPLSNKGSDVKTLVQTRVLTSEDKTTNEIACFKQCCACTIHPNDVKRPFTSVFLFVNTNKKRLYIQNEIFSRMFCYLFMRLGVILREGRFYQLKTTSPIRRPGFRQQSEQLQTSLQFK